MARKKKAGYFSNKEVLEFLKERNRLQELTERTRDEERQLWKIKENLGKAYFSISENLLRKPNFCNYDIATKTDMISDAVTNCLKAGEKYDVTYENPFAYFTQISWNAFIANIKIMKKRASIMVPITHVENMDGMDDTSE